MAPNVSLQMRVSANLDEMRARMAEAKSIVDTTSSTMKSMTNAYDGTKVIANANAAMLVVQSLGGATKLTDAAQAKLNSTLTEALEQYRVLGKEAPADMQALADATKRVSALTDEQAGRYTVTAAEMKKLGIEAQNTDKAHETLGSTVKNLVLGYVALSTIRAELNFIDNTVKEASALQDLSNQVHINVEELQLMAGGMSEFGVDADTLGKGMYKLSRGIAGGDESVASGLHMMGLSLKDVAGLNGQELFLRIEAGLATLQGGLRDDTAASLFGGKLGAAMAGASEGIVDAMNKWRALNHVASAESIAALDQYGESIERTKKSLSAFATEVMGKSAQMFNVVTDAVEKGGGKWATFWALTKDVAAQLTLTGTGTENMTRLLDELNQKTDANKKATDGETDSHKAAAVQLTAHGQAAQFMAALELDAAKPLLAWQVEYLEHLKNIGLLDAKHAEGIGVSAEQLKKYTAAEADASNVTEQLIAQYDAWDAVITNMAKVTFGLAMDHEKQWREESLKGAARVNEAVLRELDAQRTLNAEFGLTVDGQIKVTGAAEKLRVALEALHREKVDGISQEKEEQVLMNAFIKALNDEALAEDAATLARMRGNDELGKTPALANAAIGALHQLAMASGVGQVGTDRSFKASWIDIYKRRGMSDGEAEGEFYRVNAVPGHQYANGVQNAPGGWSMVGERGPEAMYVPQGADIYPSGSSIGGGGSTYITIHVNGTAADVGRKVMDEITRTMRARRQWPSA